MERTMFEQVEIGKPFVRNRIYYVKTDASHAEMHGLRTPVKTNYFDGSTPVFVKSKPKVEKSEEPEQSKGKPAGRKKKNKTRSKKRKKKTAHAG